MKLLSIIIPIYNVEKYLKRCLDSIYNQGCDQSLFEVIAVNDGSPDNSLKILQDYSKGHENLFIINQENQGVSSARNTGIDNATGDYVLFIDPDDTIKPNSLTKIFTLLKNSTIETLIMRSLKNNKEMYNWRNIVNEQTEIDGLSLFNLGYRRGSVCGCAFKLDFLNKNLIRFPLNVTNTEDSIFFSIVQIWTKTISFLDLDFYRVFERQDSASNLFTKNRVINYKQAALYIHQYLTQNSSQLNNIQNSILSTQLCGIISSWVYATLNCNETNYNFLAKNMKIKEFLPIRHLNSMPLKYKKKALIINLNFRVFYFLCYIKNKLKNRG